MKSVIAACLILLGISNLNGQAPYCTPATTFGCGFGDNIGNFSTTNGSTNIVNNGSGCSSGSYSYDTTQAVTVSQNGTFGFSVKTGNSFRQGFRIWVDWNNDFDFDDANESVWSSNTWSTTTFSDSITIPAGQAAGTYRMRVRCSWNSIPSSPCNNQSYGETEDYVLIVETGTKVVQLCYGDTPANFNNSDSASGGSGNYQYHWETSTDNGSNWTDAPGDNDSIAYEPGQALFDTTFYRRLTIDQTCMDSAYSNTIEVHVPDSLEIDTAIISHVTCNGGSDGSINLTVKGGVSPYTYDWNNGTFTTKDLDSLSSGSFTVVVTDAFGCTLQKTIAVNEASTLSVSIQGTKASCATVSDAQIIATPQGGMSPYTFKWSNGGTNDTLQSIGIGKYVLTLTDHFGCSVKDSITIDFLDTVKPVVVPRDLTVYLDSSGIDSISTSNADSASSDLCGIQTLSLSQSTFTCKDLGNRTVYLKATDVNGNSDSATFNVNVLDTIKPQAVAQNLTVYLDNSGIVNVSADSVDNGSSDNCVIDSSYLSQHQFDCDDLGINNITITVLDRSGNQSSSMATITVLDTTPPSTAPQSIVAYLDANGQVSITSGDIAGQINESCALANASLSQSNFKCSNVGPNTLTLTLTDSSGNSFSDTTVVTVVDTVAPAVITKNLTVYLGTNGQASITTPQIDNGSSDACGIQSMSLSKSSFICTDLGANTIWLVVTDVNGNTDSTQAVVTVRDTLDPVAISQNITLYLDANGQAMTTPAMVDNGSTDNCSVNLTLSQSNFDCSDEGLNLVTLTATDPDGNTSTTSALIDIKDTISPTVKTDTITLQLGATGQATIAASQLDGGSSDNCTNQLFFTASKTSFDCNNLGQNVVNLTITDGHGNSSSGSAVVIVEDNIAPVANAQNTVLQLDANGMASTNAQAINNGSSDNCSIDSMWISQSSFDCTDLGQNNIQFSVKDPSGNISNTNVVITVQDNTAPVAVAQNLTIYLDSAGQATIAPAMVDGGSSDNCGAVNLSLNQTDFSCSDLGNNTVTLTVTDAANNSSTATSTISVLDTTLPEVKVQNLTVQLDASGQASITPAMVDNGSSDNCSISNMSLDITSFDCSDIGTQNVTLTITDASNNSSSATANIVIQDVADPTAVAKNLTIQLDASGSANISAAMVNDGSSDNCSIDSMWISQSGFDCENIGQNTIQFTVSDPSGNTHTSNAIITIEDTISPTAVTQPLTVYLDGNGQASITPQMVNNGSSDNCGISSMALDVTGFDCSNLGSNTVLLTVTDNSNNSASKTANIMVLDTTAPGAIAQNISVQLDASGQAIITTAMMDNGSSDNCNISNMSLNVSSFGCSDLGNNKVTLTITDQSNNSHSATANVTVLDLTDPVAMTKNLTVQLDANGSAIISAMMVNDGSSDNCSIDSMWISESNFDCSDIGQNTIQFTVQDPSGNTSTSNAIITIQDTIDPIVITKNLTVYLNASGQGSITPQMIDNGSSDNCGINTMTLDINSFDCNDIGSNTVSLTITDNSGNSKNKTATVTVLDTTRPAVSTQDITVQLDASGQASITPAMINNGSSDNCSIASLSLDKTSFDCSVLGTNTVTLTVTDANNNSRSATANVMVQDVTDPTVVVQNLTVQLNTSGSATISPQMVDNGSSDNCSIDSMWISESSFDCTDVGQNTIQFTVKDPTGNTSTTNAIITIQDTIDPSVITQNLTVYLNASGQASITPQMVNNGSSDNCGVNTMALDISSFDCNDTGSNTVALTVTDNNGNSRTSSATITVLDTTRPSVITQNITVALDANGLATINTGMIDNGSSDNCSLSSMSLDVTSFNCSDLGANTVTLTAIDLSNNTHTSMATVTIVDNIAPNAQAQNITVYLDGSGQAAITPAMVDDLSSDNCGITSRTLDKTAFSCADIGQNTATLTATDASNNSSSATATVTVLDTISPIIVSQNITVQLDANGNAAITTDQIDNGSTDNCGIASKSLDISSFDCNDIGANTITLTITDGSNNQSTATAIVTVEDILAPTVVTRDITVSLDANGMASINTATIDSGTTDNCTVSNLGLDITSFNCSNVGTPVTVTLTATDNSSNTNSATAVVTVIDNTAPTVNTQNLNVYLDATGNAVITPGQINNGSSDNCGIETLTLDISLFDCADLGQNLVALTATDSSGNSAQQNAFVTVMDTINPTIDNLPANITAYAGPNQCATTVQWPTITASDNCNTTSVNISHLNGGLFSKGTTSVTATVQDGSGNSISQSFDITVLDTISPVITGLPINFTITPNQASCDAVVSWNPPTSFDNCGSATLTSTHTPGATFSVGSTVVTYTATDGDGNSSSASFTITVSDVVAPTISNVPANITQTSDVGSCGAVVNFTPPTFSDNCTVGTTTSSHTPGSVFPVGTTTVSYTVSDQAGNTNSASFSITITDDEKPTVSSVFQGDTIGPCDAAFIYPLPVATDNCGPVTITQIAGLPSGNVFPIGITQNRFRISDPSGNDTIVSFTIVVVPQGQPQLPGLIEICENAPEVDISLGQSALTWTGAGVVNGNTFNPSLAGVGRHQLNYSFTDSEACVATGSIVITVLPTPSEPTIVRVATTTLSTVGSYATYQWFRDGVMIPGAVNQTYSYTQGGNYQVIVGNTSGCRVHGEGFVIGSAGGGIGIDEFSLKDLDVYPNPSQGLVIIDLKEELESDLKISVHSIEGRKVYEQTHRTDLSGKLQLDLTGLPVATYILHVRGQNGMAVKRIVLH